MTATDSAESVAPLLEAAEAHRRSGRLSDARAGFIEAAKAAEMEGDPAAFVKAALGIGGIWVYEQRDIVAAAATEALWRRARDLVAAGTVDEARLAVRQAAEAVYKGAPVEAVMAAADDVRRFGDDTASAEALSLLHHVQLGPRYADARLALADEILALGARAGDSLLALMGLCWRTVDLLLLGDPRAGQSVEELRERSAAEGCEALSYIADLHGAMILARAGRLEEAEEGAEAAFARGTTAGDADAPAYYGAMLAALRYWQGREAEVIDLIRTTSTSPRLGFNDHVYVAADAMFSAAIGDADSAEEALARLSGLGLERSSHSSSSWLTTQFLVVEAAYLLGDTQVAFASGELLAPYAHLPVMPSLAVVCFGSVERSIGLCAAVTGRVDAAVHHLDAAIRADRRLGNRPMAVLTEHALAGVLRIRRGRGDGARAEQLGRRAAERAQRMGMALPPYPAWMGADGGSVSRTSGFTREAALQAGPGGWRIVVDGRVTVVADRIGLTYLAELIACPGRDVDVLRLAVDGGPTGRAAEAPPHPETSERARTAVRKALMRALVVIEGVEPDLGHHLRASLVTGATCRYSPQRGWNVTAQH